MTIFIFLDTTEKLKSELRDKQDIIAPSSREDYALVLVYVIHSLVLILSVFSLHHQFSSCLLTIMLAHIFYPLRIIHLSHPKSFNHVAPKSFKFDYLRFTSSPLHLAIRLSKLPRKVCSLTKVCVLLKGKTRVNHNHRIQVSR